MDRTLKKPPGAEFQATTAGRQGVGLGTMTWAQLLPIMVAPL